MLYTGAPFHLITKDYCLHRILYTVAPPSYYPEDYQFTTIDGTVIIVPCSILRTIVTIHCTTIPSYYPEGYSLLYIAAHQVHLSYPEGYSLL
jgi:hypothetical protein